MFLYKYLIIFNGNLILHTHANNKHILIYSKNALDKLHLLIFKV